MTPLLVHLTLQTSIAAPPCPEADAALTVLASPEGVEPAELTPANRVVVGAMLARRGDDEEAAGWLEVPDDDPVTGHAHLLAARIHRSHVRRKSAVIEARDAMRLEGSARLARDAALLEVADIYFEELHRYEPVVGYYDHIWERSPLWWGAAGRHAISEWALGHKGRAKRVLRGVPDLEERADADLIWARAVTQKISDDEALAELATLRERYAALETLADARELGGAAARVTLAPDALALECQVEAHPDDAQLAALYAQTVQAEVTWLLRRVDLAVLGVTRGLPTSDEDPRLPPLSVGIAGSQDTP